jgi:hypothetical protein
MDEDEGKIFSEVENRDGDGDHFKWRRIVW